MKRKFTLYCFLITSFIYSQTDFSRGFQKGYKDGYCYQVYGCIAPIPPLSPMPNSNESPHSYKQGYQKGFLIGKQAKSNKSNNNSFDRNTPREYPNYVQPFDFDLIEKGLRYKQQKYNKQQKNFIKKKEAELYKSCQKSMETYNKTKQFLDDYKDKILDLKNLESLLTTLYNPTKIFNKYLKQGVDNIDDANRFINELKQNDKMINDRIVSKTSEIVSWFINNPNTYVIGTFKSNKKSEYSYSFTAKTYQKDKDSHVGTKFLFEKNMLAIFNNDKVKVLFIGLSENKIKEGEVLEDGHGGIIFFDKKANTLLRFFDRDIKTNQFQKKTVYYNLTKL